MRIFILALGLALPIAHAHADHGSPSQRAGGQGRPASVTAPIAHYCPKCRVPLVWCARCRAWHHPAAPTAPASTPPVTAPVPPPQKPQVPTAFRSMGDSLSQAQANKIPEKPLRSLASVPPGPVGPLRRVAGAVAGLLRGDDRVARQIAGSNMCWCHAVSEFLEDRGRNADPFQVLEAAGAQPQTKKTIVEQAALLSQLLGTKVQSVRPAESANELRSWLADGYGAIIRLVTPYGNHAVYLQRIADDGIHFVMSDSNDGSTRLVTFGQLRGLGYSETVLDAHNGIR